MTQKEQTSINLITTIKPSINLTTSRLKCLGIIIIIIKENNHEPLGDDIYKACNIYVFKKFIALFIALLFVTAKNWEGDRCPLTDRINKLHCLCTVDLYIAAVFSFMRPNILLLQPIFYTYFIILK